MSLLCYNQGCGEKYDLELNTEDSCLFHPGVPIFHDALKGWSCCKKRTTDFSEFLSIKGCTRGRHSNEKPQEPLKPEVTQNKEVSADLRPRMEMELIMQGPKSAEKMQKERPSPDQPLLRLNQKVSKSLEQTVEKLNPCKEPKPAKNDGAETSVMLGTVCKNSGCKQVCQGPHTDTEVCHFHPGVPVFHEGMKFWNCCTIQTSDFDAFLEQKGCATGKHTWFKKEDKKLVSCRQDWHQTDRQVVVTVYAKNPVPFMSHVEANSTVLLIRVVFEGEKIFHKQIELWGVVDVEKSFVNMMPSKVEVTLVKKDLVTWGKLETPHKRLGYKVEESVLEEKEVSPPELKKEEEVEDSDDSLSLSDWE
ncbi:cysteine and histidine-rich domain-containing protein 1 isoform X2 [Latimeria chalumnae]|nr:PREDICTED: integrin beta-1-binding protein 2 [Latimeria chalumnae]|eukprot:XP_006003816.1 PREDICTED: integrin beta-1-binding protein 2 [Latimeria chalumnae]